MLEELSPNYTITVIEPFGYGLSDIIDIERTMENIVNEIHEAVKQVLGGKQYFLMAHSISGIYAMKYVNDYKNEVLGFIGLDTTTPDSFDNMKFVLTYDNVVDDIPEVSKDEEELSNEYSKKDWVKMHTNLTDGLNYTDTVIVNGNHILFESSYKESTKEINKFITNIPQNNIK